ncbi:uncharacterized protein ALTATR162_LOCUS512 [Neofusicoccum parvum]|uniref:Uncharacterized protein ALTATR162_LOCUS512 n=1 Tax=Neofusicoccum parvum TaxID=310453 RepID=A0ACB5SCG1_9PEZI|nr:uncharacterized protein ALTATR162_LOCUS512 [Neofusicoccum parvum]
MPTQTLAKGGSCEAQNSGSGPTVTPDTPEAFTASSELSNAASLDLTPDGYTGAFTYLKGATSSTGHMGYSTLQSYDTSLCALLCDNNNGCSAFNIFFERDPSLDPDDSCSNPPSTNVIKCFQVVIAGSNGYVKSYSGTAAANIPSVDGYDGGFLNNKAINAVTDCNGVYTYMGYKLFNDDQPFSPSRCADVCNAQFGSQKCRFFNTYIILKNGVPRGQICAMYSEAWESKYATNNGQWRGSDYWSIASSFSYDNTQDSGVPVCASDVSYLQTAGVSFCSSYLEFTTPTVTQTATAAAATSTETTTVYQTATITDATTLVVVTSTIQTSTTKFAVAKRDVVATPASAAGWPASKLSSACSSVLTTIPTSTVTTTSTPAALKVTATTTQTTTVHATSKTTTTTSTTATSTITSSFYWDQNKCAISYPHIIDVQVSDDKQQAIKDCLAYCNSESNCKYWEAYYYMGGGDSTYSLNHDRCATFAIDYSASNLYCPHSWNIGYSVGGKKGMQL